MFYFVKWTLHQRFKVHDNVIISVRWLGMVKEDRYIPRNIFIRVITNNEVKMNKFFPFPFPNPKMVFSPLV